MAELILKNEVYTIIGAAMDVYNNLGPGFLEAVYQEALQMELSLRGIPHQAQRELTIHYKDKILSKAYVADFVAFEKVIVEIKAMEKLGGREEAQLLNYLRATGLEVGLLINFGSDEKMEWHRMVNAKWRTSHTNQCLS